jgi:nucleoside-diphosphate-sugar epimerase
MLARQALAGGPIFVPGTGTKTWSWCYVEDLVDGLIRCLCLPAAAGRTFAIGDDRHELTVTELALLVRELTGGAVPVVHVPQPGHEVQPRKPDVTMARDLLGYRPRHGIVEGLRATVDWLAAPDQPWPMPGAGSWPGESRLAS